MDEETYPLTELDRIANGTNLLMLKALLRHLPSGKHQMFALLIKFMELQNVQSYYQNRPPQDVQAMNVENLSITELLTDMVRFCSPKQRESFAQVQNIMETIQMFENMQDMFGGETFYGESESNPESEPSPESNPEQPAEYLDE